MSSGSAWEGSIKRLALILAVLPVVACAQLRSPANWESTELTDHPLAGRIWDSRNSRFISPDEAWDVLSSSRYLLLGEKHDNPDHHRLQQMITEQLVQSGLLGQITFEMMDSDKQVLLDDIGRQTFNTLDEIKDYLLWDDNGWNWDFYGPILYTALQGGRPVRAGNISTATMGEIYAGELEREIQNVLGEQAQSSLRQTIDESHCGMLPESQFPAMARVQQARDAAMAESLMASPDSGVAVLITGNFHARRDMGVPLYLLARDGRLAADRIVSLGLTEVVAGEEQPEAYLEQVGTEVPFDLLWFTPSIGEQDYCAQMQRPAP